MPRTKQIKPDDIMVAIDTGSVDVGGTPYPVFRNRTRVRADSDIYKSAPGLFKPVDAQYKVEQATAAPGEQRAYHHDLTSLDD